MTLTLLLLGMAQAADPCTTYCDELVQPVRAACDGDDVCVDTADTAFSECASACPVEVEIPDVDGLVALGVAAAEHTFGSVDLLDQAVYLHPDGDPQSVMLVFTKDASVDLEDVRGALARGDDPARFDDQLVGMEISARLDMPPVVAHWTGVPFEYVAEKAFLPHALDRYGTEEVELVERWQSPVFPVFVYEVEGTRVYFDPRAGGVAEQVTARIADGLREDERFLIRRERLKREWTAYLDGSAFETVEVH